MAPGTRLTFSSTSKEPSWTRPSCQPFAGPAWGQRGPPHAHSAGLGFAGALSMEVPSITEVFWGCMASKQCDFYTLHPHAEEVPCVIVLISPQLCWRSPPHLIPLPTPFHPLCRVRTQCLCLNYSYSLKSSFPLSLPPPASSLSPIWLTIIYPASDIIYHLSLAGRRKPAPGFREVGTTGFHQSTPRVYALGGQVCNFGPLGSGGILLVSLQLFSFTVNFYMIASQHVLFFLTPSKLKRVSLRTLIRISEWMYGTWLLGLFHLQGRFGN